MLIPPYVTALTSAPPCTARFLHVSDSPKLLGLGAQGSLPNGVQCARRQLFDFNPFGEKQLSTDKINNLIEKPKEGIFVVDAI